MKMSDELSRVKSNNSEKMSGVKSDEKTEAKSDIKSDWRSNNKSSTKSQPQSIESIKQQHYEAQNELEVITEVKLENKLSDSQQNIEDYNFDIDENIAESEYVDTVNVEKREPIALEHKNRPETAEQDESHDTNIKLSPKISPKVTLPKLKAAPEMVKSSPLLQKAEKEIAFDYGYSLDSKKVDAVIDDVDIEAMWKCLAHALLKHIEFSKGEVLIDDLVDDDEDIPQFSYEFGQDLRIDLEEIQRKKELERWEAEVRNLENFQRLEYAMHPDYQYSPHYDDYPPHNGPFTYYESAPMGNGESINIWIDSKNENSSLLGDLPPIRGMANQNSNKFSSSNAQGVKNSDLMFNEDIPPPAPFGDVAYNGNFDSYNYSVSQMDDFLREQRLMR